VRRNSPAQSAAVAGLAIALCVAVSSCSVPVRRPVSGAPTSAPVTAPSSTDSCEEVAFEPGYALPRSPVANRLTYEEILGDTTEPVTKVGGQPNWIAGPQWPLSRFSGTKMHFLAQFSLDSELFPDSLSTMAYVFEADPEPSSDAGDIWQPGGGENAVILQPAGVPDVDTVPEATGPTIMTTVSDAAGTLREKQVTYVARLDRVTDPALVLHEQLDTLSDDESTAYLQAVEFDKIGGTPAFIQDEEFPMCGRASTLAAQVSLVPSDWNLGDGGVGYVFMDRSGVNGRYLAQSH
jgi:hypothetical protein